MITPVAWPGKLRAHNLLKGDTYYSEVFLCRELGETKLKGL